MFSDKNLTVTRLFLDDAKVKAKVSEFCASSGLQLGEADYYCGVFDGEEMLAGGGFCGRVIKYVAVSPAARSMNLTAVVVGHLMEELLSRGEKNVFVFTKATNVDIFENLAFYPVGRSEDAVLMESHPRGVKNFCKSLQEYRRDGVISAVVMNANPFTLGHRYLVEKAREQSDHVFVFVVQEDRSAVRFCHRYSLVEKGLKEIEGVTVLRGGDYIVSQATFPNYFLKEQGLIDKNCAQIDADVFGRHIAPALNIANRFVGQEPADAVTADYNVQLKKVLTDYGVELCEIPRLEYDGKPVSATCVRKCLQDGNAEGLKNLVPPATLEFLQSKESDYLKNKKTE